MFSSNRPLSLCTYAIAIFFAWLALALTVQYVQDMGFRHTVERGGDWYLGLALNLVEGNGYQNCIPASDSFRCGAPLEHRAYRLPGYPVYLATNLLLFGTEDPLPAIRLLQAVMAAMIVFLTTLLAARVGGNLAGLVAGLVMATNGLLHEFASLMLTELLFTFLLLLFVIVLTSARRAITVCGAGMLLGAAVLTRGTLLLALPFLIVLSVPRRLLAPLIAGLLLLLTPWAVRNTIVLGTFAPFSTGSGAVLWGANNPATFGIDPPGPPSGAWVNPRELPDWNDFARLPEVEQDRAFRQAAIDFLRTTSLPQHARALGAKLGGLFGLSRMLSPATAPVRLLCSVWLSILLIGLPLSPHMHEQAQNLLRHQLSRTVLTLWGGTLLNTLIFYAYWRFRFPLDPYLAIFTGIGLALCLENTGTHSFAIAAAVATVAGLIVGPLIALVTDLNVTWEQWAEITLAVFTFTIVSRKVNLVQRGFQDAPRAFALIWIGGGLLLGLLSTLADVIGVSSDAGAAFGPGQIVGVGVSGLIFVVGVITYLRSKCAP